MSDFSVNNSAQTTRTNAAREATGTNAQRNELASPEISFEDIKRASMMAQSTINRQLDALQAEFGEMKSKLRNIDGGR